MGISFFVSSVKVGFFLAKRQVQRSSIWTTALIIFVMFLTFLNLVMITGVLVGIVEGARRQNQEFYTGDVIVSNLASKNYIQQSQNIINALETIPDIKSYSARYIGSGVIQANYKSKTRAADRQDEAGTEIIGIDPEAEDRVTGLSSQLFQGYYLDKNQEDTIVLGAGLLKKYARGDAPGLDTLEKVDVGDKVRVKFGDTLKELTVRGVLRSKEGNIERRAFMLDRELRKLIGRNDLNVDEIAIRLTDSSLEKARGLKQLLIQQGFDKYSLIKTSQEAEGQFLEDIAFTFNFLGTAISSIGLIVACITIFIVIFINAITRRKFIGILKGIGVSSLAIEFSYVFQSLFYAVIGTSLGLLVLYGLLVPYFDANPVDFPFADGVLAVYPFDTFLRAVILVVATIIAGFIPARLIVKKNTLDAILGR